ncbi:replication initiation protein [Paraburkholderia domus]|uniref:replication initiation protein n=1 Tax=Paraburkholderia domus TaxID=2793075 RepID=UPI001911CC40|nr:replication initiation protein [Paraburkholderia domus]MBK5064792.1 replication initiation protein [Burkholderia sp. R-70199]CAE6956432.1 hypothetical protein R70199_06989 [Paraburkholderia domus]
MDAFGRLTEAFTTVATRKDQKLDSVEQFGLFPTADLPEPFRKATAAVHMAPEKGPLSLPQYKVFDALLKRAGNQYKKDPTRIWFEIGLGELTTEIGLNSNNRKYVKTVINSLVTFGVNWDYLAGLNKGQWNASALLAGARITPSGVLQYHYAENLKEVFLNPAVWANIDMAIIRRFQRSSSAVLYENIVRYDGIGKTPELSVDVWRNLVLGMEWKKGSYAEYKEFKRRILTFGVNEINAVSDHLVEMIEVKSKTNSRSVTAIQFILRAKDIPQVLEESDLDVLGRVTKLDVPLSEARRLLTTHGQEAIVTALDYMDQRLKQKIGPKVESVPAYFRKALVNGYKVDDKANAADSVATSPTAARTKARAVTGNNINDLFQTHRRKEVTGYFFELDAADQMKVLQRYNEQQSLASLKIESGKKMKKTTETAFYTWLADDVWGPATDSDVLTFVMNNAKISL